MSDEKVVVQAVDEIENQGAPDEVVLSSGVVLGIKPSVNPMVFVDLIDALEKDKPKPPTVFIKDLGRYEENPDHPDYIESMKMWDNKSTKRIVDALILLGTFVKHVPDGIQTQDSEDWIDDLDILGIHVGERKKERYLAWVKNVAIQSAEDYGLVQNRVGAVAGISEKEVAKATNTFPPDNRRR